MVPLYGLYIFVVDDNPDLLALATDVLRYYRARPLTACSGRDALTVFRREQDTISAVLLDVYLADRNGIEVAKLMRSINPRIPIVIMTGSVSNVPIDMPVLRKPFTPSDMVKILAEAIVNHR